MFLELRKSICFQSKLSKNNKYAQINNFFLKFNLGIKTEFLVIFFHLEYTTS